MRLLRKDGTCTSFDSSAGVDQYGMSERKSVLVIDTAMHGCGVALFDAKSHAAYDAYSDDAQGQAQVLVPMVQDVLDRAGQSFTDIDDIVVCNGPGTFTGIRIGLSVAKTFGLTMEVPVWGVSSLQAMALSADTINQDMLVIVETRRQDFYMQRFDAAGVAVDDAVSVMADEIAVGDCILIGNAVTRFDPEGAHKNAGIERVDVVAVARAFAESNEVFTSNVEPIYLRAPDVSQPKNKPRCIAPK